MQKKRCIVKIDSQILQAKDKKTPQNFWLLCIIEEITHFLPQALLENN